MTFDKKDFLKMVTIFADQPHPSKRQWLLDTVEALRQHDPEFAALYQGCIDARHKVAEYARKRLEKK